MLKKHLFFYLILVAIAFFNVGCKKTPHQEIKTPLIDTKEIKGNVIFPANTIISPSELNVYSAVATGNINADNSYNLDINAKNAHSLVFVGEKTGSLKMLGYLDGTANSQIIDAKSTALSLIMCSPWAISLSSEGRKQAVTSITENVNFAVFVSKIEARIKQGEDFGHPSNPTQLVADISDFIQHSVFKTQDNSSVGSLVLSSTNNGNLSFANTKAVTYCASVYNDNGTSITNNNPIEIEGQEWVHLSFGDIITGTFTHLGEDNPPVIYNLSQNGKYQVYASTGFEVIKDLDYFGQNPETKDAFISNITNLSFDAIAACDASIGSFISNDCFKELIKHIESPIIQAVQTDAPTNMKEVMSLVADILLMVTENAINLAIECAGKDEVSATLGSSFTTWFTKAATVIDVLSRVEGAANGSKLIYDWCSSPCKYSFCKEKNGTSLSDCSSNIIGSDKSLTGLNDCTTNAGTGSSFNNTIFFNVPQDFYIDYVIVDWYFFSCDNAEGNSGSLIIDNSHLNFYNGYLDYSTCATFASCEKLKEVLTLVDIYGNKSNGFEMETERPMGAYKGQRGVSGLKLLSPKKKQIR
jgi:hypothetical protein